MKVKRKSQIQREVRKILSLYCVAMFVNGAGQYLFNVRWINTTAVFSEILLDCLPYLRRKTHKEAKFQIETRGVN